MKYTIRFTRPNLKDWYHLGEYSNPNEAVHVMEEHIKNWDDDVKNGLLSFKIVEEDNGN